MNPSTIDLLPIADKRVFIRVDFNVPLYRHGGEQVSDDTRIREGRCQPSAMPAQREPRSFSLHTSVAPKAKPTRRSVLGQWLNGWGNSCEYRFCWLLIVSART